MQLRTICGSGDAATDFDLDDIQPEEGASLVVWESDGPEGEFLEYVGAEFSERIYGVPVRFEAVGHTDAPTKLETDGPAGLLAPMYLPLRTIMSVP